uniref:BTB and MATH domain-containing protein 43 n=1 Tax=Lygus hesperus TaxID=30085 RepID=A0A146M833_LYGHE
MSHLSCQVVLEFSMEMPIIGDLNAESSCTWTIKDFSTLSTKVGYYVQSPKFTGVGDQSLPFFSLILFPNGICDGAKGNISLYLMVSKDNDKSNSVCFELSLLNHNDDEFKSTRRTMTKVFAMQSYNFDSSYVWGYPDFISRSRLMEFLQGNTLKVRCKLKGPAVEIQKALPEEHFSFLCRQGLWQQYLNQQFVDVVVVVQESKFKVHKAVLAAHSPVLTAMFNVDMLESRQNIVTIEDCSPHSFEAFIKWMYLGEVEGTEQVHSELLALADKYNIDELKLTCEQYISSKIRVNNAIKTLQLADLYKAPLLKKRSLEFIRSRVSEISSSEDWPSLVNNPKLLEEVTLELASLVKNLQQHTFE